MDGNSRTVQTGGLLRETGLARNATRLDGRAAASASPRMANPPPDTMPDSPANPPADAAPAGATPGAARAARLAAALRANLHRRKAQARGRDEQRPGAPPKPAPGD